MTFVKTKIELGDYLIRERKDSRKFFIVSGEIAPSPLSAVWG